MTIRRAPMRIARVIAAGVVLLALNGCSRFTDNGFAACERAQGSQAALDLCSRVIDGGKASPKEVAYARMYRASAHQDQKQPEAAIADMDAAIRLLPQDPKLLTNRGALHGMQGRDEQARVDLEAAMKLDPTDVNTLGNLGVVYEHLNEFGKSRDLMKRAQGLAPNNPQVWGELCWDGAVVADQLEETLAACDKAIELSPIPNNFNSRGFAFYRAGRFEEAMSDYTHSLEGDPKVASSWLMLGLTKRALNAADAQADIDKGNAMDPKVAARYASYGIKTD